MSDTPYEKFVRKTATTSNASGYTSSSHTTVATFASGRSGPVAKMFASVSASSDEDDTVIDGESIASGVTPRVSDELDICCSICGAPLLVRVTATETFAGVVQLIQVVLLNRSCDCPTVFFDRFAGTTSVDFL